MHNSLRPRCTCCPSHSNTSTIFDTAVGLNVLFCAPQCLPCVSRSFSCLGCYLRSILLWCVCWSRSTCTFLVELVRKRCKTWENKLGNGYSILKLSVLELHNIFVFRFCLIFSLCHLFHSNYQPPLISVQPHTQHVGSCSVVWILPRCNQCKWNRDSLHESEVVSVRYFWSKSIWTAYNLILCCCFYIRHRGGMPMCQYCSLCSVACCWPYPTTSVAKAVIPPSCGQYFVFHNVSNDLGYHWKSHV